MYNHGNKKPLDYYRVFTQINFWLLVIPTIILTIMGWCGNLYITDSPFLAGLIVLGIGMFMAFSFHSKNMAIIQGLEDAEYMREKMEETSFTSTGSSA